MKKMFQEWKAYLALSQKEAWGTVLLAAGLLGLTFLLSVSDYLFRGDPVRILPEDSLRIVAWLRETPVRQNRAIIPSIPSYAGPPIEVEKVSKEQLTSMGLPAYLAERWVKYRAKGGKIHSPQDVEKLYGMTTELVNQITPHLRFSTTSTSRVQNSTGSPKSSFSFPKQAKPKVPSRFDINTADTTVWKTLPGIGSGYARRICSFREKLGGFVRVDQVMETYQLPVELAPVIEKYGFIGTPHRKIQINQVAEIRHPYLPFAQAKAILAYRTQHGPFSSLDDLRAVKRLSPEILEKIAPYVSFEH